MSKSINKKKLRELREIEDSLLKETLDLTFDCDSELYFEEIEFDTHEECCYTYTVPVDGDYFFEGKVKTYKKGDIIYNPKELEVYRVK